MCYRRSLPLRCSALAPLLYLYGLLLCSGVLCVFGNLCFVTISKVKLNCNLENQRVVSLRCLKIHRLVVSATVLLLLLFFFLSSSLRPDELP